MVKRKALNLDGQGRTASQVYPAPLPCGWPNCQRDALCRLDRGVPFWRDLQVTHEGTLAALCRQHYEAVLNAEVELRWPKLAKKYGLDPALHGRDRAIAVARATGMLSPQGKVVPRLHEYGKPNLAHMHALLDAVESGTASQWRRHPISFQELAAAYRATGRTPPPPREPGEDREEHTP